MNVQEFMALPEPQQAAMVAEKVMGLTVAHDMTVGDLVRYRPANDPGLLVPVPPYPADIAAAWQVVDHMEQAGRALELNKTWLPDLSWHAAFDKRFELGPSAEAPTPPLAICAAALLAVGAITQ